MDNIKSIDKKGDVNQDQINQKLHLGRRKVSRQNFSYVTTLPKIFTDSCLDENMEVELTLENCRLVLTPVRNMGSETE